MTKSMISELSLLLRHSLRIPRYTQVQKQHLEISRDIAERFNNTFGETFVLPEPLISDEISVIPGIDGQKMSKSYNNTINIFEEEKGLKKKVMKIVTDSTPVEEPKDPEKCNVFALYKLFVSENELNNMAQKYREGGTGYGDIKKELLGQILEYFRPFKEKREMYQNDVGEVYNIMKKGAEKTRKLAVKMIDDIKDKVGLKY